MQGGRRWSRPLGNKALMRISPCVCRQSGIIALTPPQSRTNEAGPLENDTSRMNTRNVLLVVYRDTASGVDALRETHMLARSRQKSLCAGHHHCGTCTTHQQRSVLVAPLAFGVTGHRLIWPVFVEHAVIAVASSPGTVFLFAAMWATSRMRSTREPSIPLGRRSTSTMWLLVPPLTRVAPRAAMAFASACTVCRRITGASEVKHPVASFLTYPDACLKRTGGSKPLKPGPLPRSRQSRTEPRQLTLLPVGFVHIPAALRLSGVRT